jgi:hypothetical protein
MTVNSLHHNNSQFPSPPTSFAHFFLLFSAANAFSFIRVQQHSDRLSCFLSAHPMANDLYWFTKTSISRRLDLLLLLLFSTIFFSIPVSAGTDNSSQAMAPRSGVLIPLYIYPVKGAWDPLYQA